MTELQKLSLKKLRKSKDPLFVLDRKSKKGGFVILNLDAYEKLSLSENQTTKPETIPQPPKLNIIDFRQQGLFWDRPQMTNEEFTERLADKNHPEHLWATGRLLERTPSMFATRLLSLQQLKEDLPRIKLRSPFKEAWNHALHYWTQSS